MLRLLASATTAGRLDACHGAHALPCCPALLTLLAGSRPSSRATSSRPGSRADAAPGPRDGGALASVPEEAAAAAGKPVLGSWRQAVANTAAAAAAAASSNEPGQAAAEASGLHDDDGFLIDSSVDASLEQEAEVRDGGGGRCLTVLHSVHAGTVAQPG